MAALGERFEEPEDAPMRKRSHIDCGEIVERPVDDEGNVGMRCPRCKVDVSPLDTLLVPPMRPRGASLWV